ncbi:BrnA antitoxin family protein [Aquabacter sp. CN5-332]|uniref:BrnA antitoxin family protein n=1 Tax=Aquabacter sp. CN5-332 TaxID=3156608 RepID=UPI0032B3F6A9
MKKVDAHVPSPAEYEEIPELDAAAFAEAVEEVAGKPKGGRPRSDSPKQAVNIRLSPEVVEHFRSSGPGWQTRIDAVLKAHVVQAGRRRA